MELAAFIVGQVLGTSLAVLITYLVFGGPLDRFRDRH